MHDSPNFRSRYEIIKRLAKGGFGEVYKAKDKVLNDIVAIKMIAPDLDPKILPKILGMLHDEATLTRKLQHPNIVTIYDVLNVDSKLAIVMQYIDGVDLARFILKFRAPDSHIPAKLALYTIGEVCQALNYAHNAIDANDKRPLKIIHRDVSPSNIMITYEGDIKVIDFGIAKGDVIRQAPTTHLSLKGKWNYMSPEHFEPSKMDHRSDIFPLGAVLYETLTSEKLFDSAYTTQLYAEVKEAAISQQKFDSFEIPAEVERIIKKAAERDLEKRYQSAGEMFADIEAYLMRFGSRPELKRQLRELMAELSFAEEGDFQGSATPVTPLPTPVPVLPPIQPPSNTEPEIRPINPAGRNRWRRLVVEKSKALIAACQPMLVKLKSIGAQIFSNLRRGEWSRRTIYLPAAGVAIVLLVLVYFLSKALAPAASAITLQTVPPGATVIANGKTLEGVTPVTLKAGPSDTLKLQFIHHGLPDLYKTLHLSELHSALAPFVFQINVRLASRPDRVTVLINDTLWQQTTPTDLLWEINKPLRLELQTAGFAPLKDFVAEWLPDWERPKSTSATPEFWKMTPSNDQTRVWVIEGTFFKAIRINSIPANAEILLGKNSMGLTNRDTLRLPPGDYDFALRKQGYLNGRLQLKVSRNTPADTTGLLARPVRVAAPNNDAPEIIFVADGKNVPIEFGVVHSGRRQESSRFTSATKHISTPVELILACAPHRITVAKRGYLDQTIVIDGLSKGEVALPELRRQPEGFKIEVVEAGTSELIFRGAIFYRQILSKNHFSEVKKFGDIDAFGTHVGNPLVGEYQFKVEKCPGYNDSGWSKKIKAEKGKRLTISLSPIQRSSN